MEGNLTPADQKDMALGCAEFIPADAKDLRLGYRNLDTNFDIFHYKTSSSFGAILKKVETKWVVVGKGDSLAYLKWDGDAEPWQHEPYAVVWMRSGEVAVCRSKIPDPGHDSWCLEKISRHSPIPLPIP